jgi:hypothetical protein
MLSEKAVSMQRQLSAGCAEGDCILPSVFSLI